MKLFKVTRVSFATTLSVLLCAAVISGCGSSKDSKKETPVIGSTPQTTTPPIDAAPGTGTQNGIPAPTQVPGAPLVTSSDHSGVGGGAQAAPVGAKPSKSIIGSGSATTTKDKKPKTPDFKDQKAVITGGKSGSLNYTSAADDGLMDQFRTNAAGVPLEQQKLNRVVAESITGARLTKNGADMNLDLVVTEGTVAKIVRLKATTEGNRMKLSLITSTADSEFQGGFLKCLEASCDDAYAKIKIEGGYARIIFRTTNMNNNFGIQEKIADADFTKWTSYIYNTIQGSGGNAQIASVKASSYEVLNGKAAMGVQLLTADNEAFSLATPLLAPDAGTQLAQEATKYADPSVNYNLPGTARKSFVLSKLVKAVTLVNNNGQGGVRLKLDIGTGSIWMVLSRVPKATMMPSEVKAFEGTFPQAW